MPDNLVFFISHYGYLAIFLFVFLQEVGAPTPLPNELILLFTGYLVFTGILHVPVIILTVCAGDLLAATLLYIVFYFFGNFILTKPPRCLPLSRQSIEKQAKKINQKGIAGIFIGRLSPFIRGYVAVICGLTRLSPRKYGIIIFITTTIWSCGYITAGYFLGPYWNYAQAHIDSFKYILMIVPLGFVLWIVVRFICTRINNKHVSKLL
jgi:membrane protein DedA with SNARE-associated domain